MRQRQIWIHTLVLVIYTLLALLLTWPLVTHFTTHVPGDGIDDPALAWNLWWIKERLVDQRNLDIFHVDWMFFPIEINLGFYTLTPLNGLLSVPLQSAFSLITASNLLLLSSYILGGYGTFLLVRYLLVQTTDNRQQTTDDRGQTTNEFDTQYSIRNTQYASRFTFHVSPTLLPALLAGIIYAFASSKLFYAGLGQFNIASSQWIPFTVLYILRTGESRRWRDAALAAAFLGFQAWAELTYASFLLLFIALYLLWHLVAYPGKWTTRLKVLPPFAFMGLLFAAAISPFLWAMAPDLRREGDFFASGGGFADVFSADLAGYLLPTRLHPLLGQYVAALPFPNDKGQQIFAGYSALLLALAGALWLIRWRGWRGLFWPLITLSFFWLTLGAEVRWLGQPAGIPGPFELVSRLPFFSGNRYPSRYGVMLMLLVAILAGYGLAWLLRNLSRAASQSAAHRGQGSLPFWQPVLSILLIGIFLFEHLSVPLPLNDFRIPPIYQRIAAEPGDFTLLELPTGWRNGARVMGRSDILIMMQQWYQTAHGKRRLGGNTSRNPAYKFQYFTSAPLLGDLILLMNADAEVDGRPYLAAAIESEWQALLARNQATAPLVLDFLNVRYVLLHPERSPPALIRFVEEALPVTLVEEWQGTDWQGQPASTRLYEVNCEGTSARGNDWHVNLGGDAGQLLLAEGWSLAGVHQEIRYATRTEAELLLSLPERGGRLTFHLYGPAVLQAVHLNQRALHWKLSAQSSAYQVVEVEIPPGVGNGVVDRLSFNFDRLTPVNDVLALEGSGWPVGATDATLPGDRPVMAVSAGKDGGDFAAIFVGGADLARNQLGYNLVALDRDGHLLESVVFNTLISTQESAAMAEWLSRWPPGTIIAGAVRDEASYNLEQRAVDALQQIGVETDLRGHFRGSHAFIGVVGAPAGSALESFSSLGPAMVAAGPPLDAPAISGGIGLIEFQINKE
jgi:hypothetical protein